jgi:hypothetical protein
VGGVPRIAQAVGHEPVPQRGDRVGGQPSRQRRAGETEPRQRGRDDGERVRGVTAMRLWVGQQREQVQILAERARPAVGQQQRQRVRATPGAHGPGAPADRPCWPAGESAGPTEPQTAMCQRPASPPTTPLASVPAHPAPNPGNQAREAGYGQAALAGPPTRRHPESHGPTPWALVRCSPGQHVSLRTGYAAEHRWRIRL